LTLAKAFGGFRSIEMNKRLKILISLRDYRPPNQSSRPPNACKVDQLGLLWTSERSDHENYWLSDANVSLCL
jgi:hypothetical protein